jgi:hypothetical protein
MPRPAGPNGCGACPPLFCSSVRARSAFRSSMRPHPRARVCVCVCACVRVCVNSRQGRAAARAGAVEGGYVSHRLAGPEEGRQQVVSVQSIVNWKFGTGMILRLRRRRRRGTPHGASFQLLRAAISVLFVRCRCAARARARARVLSWRGDASVCVCVVCACGVSDLSGSRVCTWRSGGGRIR